MCARKCLCNTCYRKKKCIDCEHMDMVKEVNCSVDGLTECNNYVEFRQS
jgi:hypothetical protein